MCELDIIFNYEKALFMLDELLLGGEIQETSKKNVLKAIAAQDLLQEVQIKNNLYLSLKKIIQYRLNKVFLLQFQFNFYVIGRNAAKYI